MSSISSATTTTMQAPAARSSAPPDGSFSGWRRSMSVAIVLCAISIAAADALFYRRTIGCTAAIFALALAGVVCIRGTRRLATRAGIGLLAAIALLSLCLLEQPGPLRITMTLLAILTLAAVNSRGWTSSVSAWIIRWIELASGGVLFRPLRDLVLSRRWNAAHRGRRGSAGAIAKWIVPLLFSAVFVWLFSLANPVVSSWIGRAADSIGRFLSDIGEYVSFGRIVLWLAVGSVSWTLMRGRVRLRGERIESALFSAEAWSGNFPKTDLVVRCLVLFNAVFLAEMAIDLVTVLSNGANLPAGVSYAQYAHRGAYPLVATALLAAAFTLVAFPTHASVDRSSRPVRLAHALVVLWIVQNIALTASAMWRLHMYVDAFGLTRLRAAAGVWMLLVALGLAWIIWRVVRHRTNAWLLRANFATLMLALLACCTVNWERLIASYDAAKCMEIRGEGPRIDLEYLSSLGPDAIPTLDWLMVNLPPGHPKIVEAATRASYLRASLREDLNTWQGWTWRRSKLAAAAPDDASQSSVHP